MRPRPRSRKKPVEYVAPDDLLTEVRRLREALGFDPAYVVVGAREWRLISTQPEARPHCQWAPGDTQSFDGVPVLVRRDRSRPRVYGTVSELEAELFGRN